MEPRRQITILMIGKTGGGKSTTGNTLLRKYVFKSASSATSVTKDVKMERRVIDNLDLGVVDGPGLGDTDLSDDEEVIQAVSAVQEALALAPEGFDAILYVAGYGTRFTNDYKQHVRLLQCVLGKDALKQFGIFVLTRGDLYDPKETGMTFSEWIQAQKSVFRDILEACGNRIVLFDNKTKEKAKQTAQLNDLFGKISGQNVHPLRYTLTNFDLAETSRQKLLVEVREPVIKAEVAVTTAKIAQQLSDVAQWEPERQVEELMILETRLESLIMYITNQDRSTGVLGGLKANVETVMNTLCKQQATAMRVMTSRAEEAKKLAELAVSEEIHGQARKQHIMEGEAILRHLRAEEERQAERQRELERLAAQRRREARRRRARVVLDIIGNVMSFLRTILRLVLIMANR